MKSHVGLSVSIADEIWIATALLHREHPDSADFSLQEIAARVRREGVSPALRAGVQPHISLHCVANRPPNPSVLRMLVETGKSRRRLFRPGDPFDPGRASGRTHPKRGDIPVEYEPLLRADRTIRPPDAIQLACAAAAGVDLFITNDERLSSQVVAGVKFVTSLDRAPF